MSAHIDYFQKLRGEGHAQEAAEWAKALEPFFPESDVRALLGLLADEVMNPTPRQPHDTFKGDKPLPPDYGNLVRRVDQGEWERQIYVAVMAYQGTQNDAFLAIGERFSTGPKNVERIYRKWKKRIP